MKLSAYIDFMLQRQFWVCKGTPVNPPPKDIPGYTLHDPYWKDYPKEGDVFSYDGMFPIEVLESEPDECFLDGGVWCPRDWGQYTLAQLVDHVFDYSNRYGIKPTSLYFWKKNKRRIYKPSIFAEPLPLP